MQQPNVQNLPVDHIRIIRNTRQRVGDLSELTASIQARGVDTPITVRPAPDSGFFELAVGQRRLLGSKAAGLDVIPARIRELTDHELVELQLTENSQRKDVHALEEALDLQVLHERYTLS